MSRCRVRSDRCRVRGHRYRVRSGRCRVRAFVAGHLPASQPASRQLLASPGPQGPAGDSCDRGEAFGGREPIFKFSHTKKFCGNRLSTNELRLACEPLTGPRRVYKWAEKRGKEERAVERRQALGSWLQCAPAAVSLLNHSDLCAED